MFFTPALHLNQFLSETHKITRAFAVPATEARKKLIDTAIRGLKDAGSWALIDVFWAMQAHTEQAGCINWKNPGTFTLSPQSSIAFTADQGFTGDGAADYVNTTFNPSTHGVNYTLNSMHAAVRIRTTSGASENATDFGNANCRIDSRRVTNTFLTRANNVNNITASNSTAGYFLVNRSASNAIQVYKDGASLTTSAEASTAIENNPFAILANGTGPGGFSTKQASFAHAGGSLTGTQVADTDSVIDTYIAGL